MNNLHLKKPIFIVGSARSGTVFLGKILKDNSKIHCLIERPDVFNFASYLGLNPSFKEKQENQISEQLKKIYIDAWKINLNNCKRCSSICHKSSNFAWYSLKSCCQQRTIERYADKSHQHVLNVSILLKAFPDAQFLHIVRDGRDVVSSMLRHPGVLSWFSDLYINDKSHWPHPWFGVKNSEHFEEWITWSLAKKCALRWTSWVDAGLQAKLSLSEDQWLDIRYEELVTNPLETSGKIFSFLDLHIHNEARVQAHASSIERWKKDLSDSELKDVLSISENLLETLNYFS